MALCTLMFRCTARFVFPIHQPTDSAVMLAVCCSFCCCFAVMLVYCWFSFFLSFVWNVGFLEFRRCLIGLVGEVWRSLSLVLSFSLSPRIIYLILAWVSRFCVLIHQSSVPAIDGSLFSFLRNDVGLLLDLLVLEHEVNFLVVLDGCSLCWMAAVWIDGQSGYYLVE